MPDDVFHKKMNYFIITGASKGFGLAIAHRLASAPDNRIVGIARTRPDLDLANVTWIEFDLSAVASIPGLVQQIHERLSIQQSDSVFLINNAGVVTPVGPAVEIDSVEMIKTINVNAVAPVILSIEFLKRRAKCSGRFGIVNLSTGAAKNPYAGWSSYCSSKALLEMFTACASIENPNLLIRSYNPGVIDTGMQETLRSQSEERFSSVAKFIALHEQGKLQSSHEAAEKFVSEIFNDFV